MSPFMSKNLTLWDTPLRYLAQISHLNLFDFLSFYRQSPRKPAVYTELLRFPGVSFNAQVSQIIYLFQSDCNWMIVMPSNGIKGHSYVSVILNSNLKNEWLENLWSYKIRWSFSHLICFWCKIRSPIPQIFYYCKGSLRFMCTPARS